MITVAEYLLPNDPPMGCLVPIFTIRINSNSIPWTVSSVPERYLPKFSATSDVRYSVLKPQVRGSAYVA